MRKILKQIDKSNLNSLYKKLSIEPKKDNKNSIIYTIKEGNDGIICWHSKVRTVDEPFRQLEMLQSIISRAIKG